MGLGVTSGMGYLMAVVYIGVGSDAVGVMGVCDVSAGVIWHEYE